MHITIKQLTTLLLSITLTASLTGCHWSKRDRNTAIGAGVGGAAGAAVTGSALGTAGGAAIGGIIGHQVGK